MAIEQGLVQRETLPSNVSAQDRYKITEHHYMGRQILPVYT